MQHLEVDEAEGLKAVSSRLFHGLADSYDRILDGATLLQDRYWKRWAVERSVLGRSEAVLDVGCGTCVMEERLEGAGCQVVGLDLSDWMLRIGLRKRLGCSGALLNADAEALPFPEASFDVVVSCYAVKYCDLERFSSEVSRVLKPGGRAVIYDFVRPKGPMSPILSVYIYGFLKVAEGLLRRVDSGVSYTFEALPEIIRRTTWNDELTTILRGHNLVVVERAVLSGGAVEGFVAQRQLQAQV
ncbi:MAG: methyltransferase domain-containing protein [Nitrososphaerales archaeon]|nr:methyltransferase domain-containing protein [Nitrososphaerales archaeon]